MLQLEYCFGVEQVRRTIAPPLELTANFECLVSVTGDSIEWIRAQMPLAILLRDDINAHAAELAERAGEVLVDKLLRKTNGLKRLGTAIRRHGGNSHLGHDFEQTLAQSLDHIRAGLLSRDFSDVSGSDKILGGLHSKIRVDC